MIIDMVGCDVFFDKKLEWIIVLMNVDMNIIYVFGGMVVGC